MAYTGVMRQGANTPANVRDVVTALNKISPATSLAAAAAITAYTAHASGATAVTSNAATDLDTTAAGLATLEDEVTALTTMVNSMRTILVAAGIIA